MIHGVRGEAHRQPHARNVAFSERASHRFRQVLVGDGRDRLVRIGERIFQVFHDLVLAGEGRGAGFISDIDWWLLLEECRGEFVIHGGHVLDLLREGTDTFEFAIRRREVELVGGHGIGGRNEFVLNVADRVIEDLGGCVLFGSLVSLRQCGEACGEKETRKQDQGLAGFHDIGSHEFGVPMQSACNDIRFGA